MEEELEKELEQLKENHHVKKVGNLYLMNYQQEILQKYHVPFKTCQTMKELLFYLSDIVDEEEFDELELVANELQEFSYYHETRK